MATLRAILDLDAGEVEAHLDADAALLERRIGLLTPLAYVSEKGYLEVVKVLTARGADIHAVDHVSGMTALHHAVEKGHEEVVDYLLLHGANPTHMDRLRWTPLMRALIMGHLTVVARLLREPRVLQELDATNNTGYTALHHAASKGHVDMVQCLFSAGARADTRGTDDRSPLVSAVYGGHVEVARFLVAQVGPEELLRKEPRNLNFLQTYILRGDGAYYYSVDKSMVAFLLSIGLEPNARDNLGETALMYAARYCTPAVVRMLIKHMKGQGLDAGAHDGCTALHWAVYGDASENLRALLLAGADPSIVNNDGRTPRALAQLKGQSECVAVFEWWDVEADLQRREALQQARAMHDEANLSSSKKQKRQTAEEQQAAEEEDSHDVLKWVVKEVDGLVFEKVMDFLSKPRN